MVTEVYDIDPKHSSLVIGKRGAGINSLRQIPGVHNVNFNTSHPSVHKLTVMAADNNTCQKGIVIFRPSYAVALPKVHPRQNIASYDK